MLFHGKKSRDLYWLLKLPMWNPGSFLEQEGMEIQAIQKAAWIHKAQRVQLVSEKSRQMERPAGKIRTLNGEVMWHIFSLLVEHFFLILLFQLFSKLVENSDFLIF